MKRNFRKALALLLFALLLLSAATLSVSAEDTEVSYTVWEVSEDGETLTGDGRVYHRYYGERALIIDAETKYFYHQKITLPDDHFAYAEICAPHRGAEILWVYNDLGYGRIFATDAGADSLDALTDGDVPVFTLLDGYYRTPLSVSLVDALEQARADAGSTVSMPVSRLEDVPCYTVIAEEETASLSYDYGAIYHLDDGYYYVNYYELDNSYFDSDGFFSYRHGSVSATLLGDDLVGAVDAALGEGVFRTITTEYEEYPSGDGDPDSERLGVMVLFWSIVAFVGYLLPIPCLVLGIVLPHSASLGRPRHWYALAIVAGVWILLALILTLVLLL